MYESYMQNNYTFINVDMERNFSLTLKITYCPVFRLISVLYSYYLLSDMKLLISDSHLYLPIS